MAGDNVTPLRGGRRVTGRIEAQKKPVVIYLWGATKVIGPTGEDILPRAKKDKAVFAILCLAKGQVVARSRLADLLWDRSGERQGLDSLRHALIRLARLDGNWKLERDDHTVRLDTTGCWVDAFEVPDHPDRLLQDLYGTSAKFDQWLLGERSRTETRWKATLQRKLESLIAERALPEIRAQAARDLLLVVPTHEIAVRSLMAAFVDQGEPAEAVREFERHKLLCDSLDGLPIAPATRNLYEQIRVGEKRAADRLSSGLRIAHVGEQLPRALAGNDVQPSAGFSEPSIAVLPFRNLSSTRDREFLVEWLSEDVSEAISRLPSLVVVSRRSASLFRKQDRSTLEIGTALGVRYLLSGSVRMTSDRLRLNVELAEPATDQVFWRDHFDENLSNLLELQSGLAEAVVTALAPEIRAAELRRLRLKRAEDYTAYDFLLRAQEAMHSASPMVFDGAKQMFEAALAREADYAPALAGLAHWYVLRIGQGFSRDHTADTDHADALARRAIECDPREALAFAVQGHVAAYLHKDFDGAFGSFSKALSINPSQARAWLWNANTHAYVDEGASAVEKISRAMSLSPYDPMAYAYSASATLAYLSNGQFARAIEFAQRTIAENRRYTSGYKGLILALVLAGHETEAIGPVRQLLALEPKFTVDQFRSQFPGNATRLCNQFCDAFAIAGLPRAA